MGISKDNVDPVYSSKHPFTGTGSTGYNTGFVIVNLVYTNQLSSTAMSNLCLSTMWWFQTDK